MGFCFQLAVKVGVASSGPSVHTAIHQSCSPDRPEALGYRNTAGTSRMTMCERQIARWATMTQSGLFMTAW